ncbi:MAG: DNA translocase FtsK [Desulfobacterales bacterium]|nr:DNA translocase FtsK [Desulfobacterales bacterium]
MRKEILGIFLFFLVIFTLVSLLSFSLDDPSINNAKPTGDIHNLFGLFGSHVSGILIGLFGLGAFWVPILLLLISVHFFGNHPGRAVISTIAGGLILIITTGSLLTFQQNHFLIIGERFSSGGIIGLPLKTFFVKYSNTAGGFIFLALIWVVGFMLATGVSLITFSKRIWQMMGRAANYLKTRLVKWKERREKAKRIQIKKEGVFKKKQEVKIKGQKRKPIKIVPVPRQEVFEFMRSETGFHVPSANLLDDPPEKPSYADDENLRVQSKLLEKKLDDFGVEGKVVAVIPGPVITTFEYEPAPGVKINKIVNLTDDLALALRSISIRIVAPIPGKAVIGIEIPNANREIVKFKEIVGSGVFKKSKSKLTICLGKNIVGEPFVANLDSMPHLLIAGATGAGKSVALNGMICSMLFKSTPDDVKLILIDPKRIELSTYNGIPHLISPVVTDARKATNALFWAVREMEKRYEMLSANKAKNITQYNQKVEKEKKEAGGGSPSTKLPYIVIIIDELADLMMVASRDVEFALTRLAQMARAAGIHLIIATQRPSVDVLTGVIKANFPTRLSFQVSSKTDSRTIIDSNGAESLLGSGDMLFLPPGTAKLQRIHGAYISEVELARISEFLKSQKPPEYDMEITKLPPDEKINSKDEEHDERYDDAIALITKTRQASISMIQRHLRIGYNRAARIIEMMEKEGVVGPSDGVKPREVLVRGYDNIP